MSEGCFLDKLPKRLFEYLLSFCSIRSIGRLSCCSKKTKQLLDSDSLWKNLCLRDQIINEKIFERIYLLLNILDQYDVKTNLIQFIK